MTMSKMSPMLNVRDVVSFSSHSEKILREGHIIDDWEKPMDMFTRIILEFTRIEAEVVLFEAS